MDPYRTRHTLWCTCVRCHAVAQRALDHIVDQRTRAEHERLVTIAAWEAGLIYEFMERWPGDLTLRRAAELAAAAHRLPSASVRSALQKTHGSRGKRGRRWKHREAA